MERCYEKSGRGRSKITPLRETRATHYKGVGGRQFRVMEISCPQKCSHTEKEVIEKKT